MKNTKLDDESHQSLLKTLKMHCNMPITQNSASDVHHESLVGDGMIDASSSNVQECERSMLSLDSCDTATEARNDDATIGQTESKSLTEVEQLKQQLAAAEQKIAVQEEKLAKARTSKPPSRFHSGEHRVPESAVAGLCDAFGSTAVSGPGAFVGAGLGTSNTSTAYSTSMFTNQSADFPPAHDLNHFAQGSDPWAGPPGRNLGGRSIGTGLSQLAATQPQPFPYLERSHVGAFMTAPTGNRKTFDDNEPPGYGAFSQRASISSSREGSTTSQNTRSSIWDTYSGNSVYSAMPFGPSYSTTDIYQPESAFGPRPIGTPLSATANEFTVSSQNGPWNTVVSLSLLLTWCLC
jgi:hypothetical protein